jgi:hypothetical protein
MGQYRNVAFGERNLALSLRDIFFKFAERVAYEKTGNLLHVDVFFQYIDWSFNVHAEH